MTDVCSNCGEPYSHASVAKAVQIDTRDTAELKQARTCIEPVTNDDEELRLKVHFHHEDDVTINWDDDASETAIAADGDTDAPEVSLDDLGNPEKDIYYHIGKEGSRTMASLAGWFSGERDHLEAALRNLEDEGFVEEPEDGVYRAVES